MTRDQQIGLALGILLVGAVSAFFFRHENPPARKLPALKTAAELDREIAERQHAPYLPEAVEDTDQFFPAEAAPFADSLDGGLVPEPIALEADVSELNLASSPTAETARRGEFHVVRHGDTLSSIAQQYLGSTAKYQDIYEANRDRLRTPNDLRIGQELRIPLSGPVASGPIAPRITQNDKPAASTPDEQPSSDASNERRFVPFRGSPLTPGAKEPSSSASSSTSGRRLSQLPPKGDTVIR